MCGVIVVPDYRYRAVGHMSVGIRARAGDPTINPREVALATIHPGFIIGPVLSAQDRSCCDKNRSRQIASEKQHEAT
jgi:hypothetical protein